MIEVLARQATVRTARTLGHLFRHRWLLFLGVLAIALAFVCARLHYVRSQRPAHWFDIASAYGAARDFFGPPQMNHAGTQLAFVATADTRGISLFLCDTASGKKQELVCDRQGSGGWHDTFNLRVWPWSPDDQAVAYSVDNDFYYCPIDTNHPPVLVRTNAAIADLVWLNPSELAWREGKAIWDARQQADGHWTTRRLPLQGQVASLTAIDDHTIAWLQEDYICRFDLGQEISRTNNPFAAPSAEAYTVPATNDLVLWLDASTLQQSNGTPVRFLADLSPKHNNAITDRNPPVFSAPEKDGGLRGKGTIHFSSGPALTNATGLKTYSRLGISGARDRSVFAVVRRNGNRAMLVNIGSTATNGTFFGLSDQNDALYLPSGNFRGGRGGTPGRLRQLPASWHILEAIYDGTTVESYVNGGRVATLTLPFRTTDREVELGLRSGPRPGQVEAASDGDFAELLIYNRALQVPEQRQVEAYLGSKWFGAMPLSPQSPLVWLDPQTDGLTALSYSKATGQLLLTRSENGRDSIYLLSPSPPLHPMERGPGGEVPASPPATPSPPLHPVERGPGGEVPANPSAMMSSPSPPQEERAGERRPPSPNPSDGSLSPPSSVLGPPSSALSLQPSALSLILEGRLLQDVHWTGPESFAYTTREANRAGVVLSDLHGNRQTLFQHADVQWFSLTPDRKQVLFWGNLNHEPCPGIWQYEIASSTLRPVVPGTDQPSASAKEVVPFHDFIQVDPRRRINYTIYPPANFDRHKKYPLVIGDTLIADPIHGQMLQAGIAACGAYVALVERPFWGVEIEQWEENVMRIYHHLVEDPCIDSKCVFLFGASAETQYMSQCLEHHPGLWKGALYLNPSQLPDFSKSSPFGSRPKILLSAGGEEHAEPRFKRFQTEVVNYGSTAEYTIHPGETHRIVGAAAKLERLRAITRLIFED